MHQGWPVGQIGGHTHQVVFVITGIAALLKIGVFGNKMLNFSDGKFAFLRGVGMFTHFKRATGKKLLQLVEALVRSRATSSASKRFSHGCWHRLGRAGLNLRIHNAHIFVINKIADSFRVDF